MAERFGIEFSRESKREFDALRVYDQRRVLDAIEAKLKLEPGVETRDRKCLGSESANFDYMPPLWELRVGEFRIFYEVDVDDRLVYVLAVRRKPSSKTTSEVLNEADSD
jgi:mRNA-degrading endonuclease RelE of RelBE toxin-antitoxin system